MSSPPPALRRGRCLVEILRSSARRPPGPYLRPAGPGCPSPSGTGESSDIVAVLRSAIADS
jgi:hypothetical protein